MQYAEEPAGAFRYIPYMGVIYVVAEAMKLGFENGHPEWSNLGQGQPEVGEMDGAPPRFDRIDIAPGDHAYGPIGGSRKMRQAVADHYNRLYRTGQRSQYTADHVSVASGGRLVLSRIFAALGECALGYQIPDYTAYEDMIGSHHDRLTEVLITAHESDGFRITAERFAEEVQEHRLGAFVVSNPCNPTGAVIQGEELRSFLETGRRQGCTLIFDEFYSHFIYRGNAGPGAGPVSAARYVDDVDTDRVLIVDGLTKSFRYPGWRIGWTLGPREMMDTLGRAASAIDGGPSQPMQRAAIEVLRPERADQETRALRDVFSRKRNIMVERLQAMGIRPCPEPEGTFYVWASIADLPEPLNEGDRFFRAALEHRVMVVPGVFFDVNPGRRRRGASPFRQWLRFSFGPPEDNMIMGLDRLQAMIQAAR